MQSEFWWGNLKAIVNGVEDVKMDPKRCRLGSWYWTYWVRTGQSGGML